MTVRLLQIAVGAALVAAAAAVLAETPAQAASPQAGEPSVQVQFREADLRSGAGAEKVYRRLEHAAADVCGDDGGFVRQLRVQQEIKECENSAVADAVARIDRPLLTNVYESNSPEHPLRTRLREASVPQSTDR